MNGFSIVCRGKFLTPKQSQFKKKLKLKTKAVAKLLNYTLIKISEEFIWGKEKKESQKGAFSEKCLKILKASKCHLKEGWSDQA